MGLSGHAVKPEPGATAGFDAFFATHYRSLQAVALALTGRRALAEELAQEAMIVVYKKWSELEGYEDPAGFARRVVTNKAVSAFRRLAAEARAVARIRSHAPSIAEDLPTADRELWRHVRALPARQRIAVTLRYAGDLDTREIAAVLDCPDTTVRVLLHRAHRALGTKLHRDDWQDA